MKKKIYVLTSQFPFGKGETFLIPEMKMLEKDYDVTIIPYDDYEDVNYKVNDTTKIIKYKKKHNIFLTLIYLILFFIEGKNEIIDILKKKDKINLKINRIKDSVHFYVAAKYYGRFLKLNNLIDENVLYYSYWSKYYTLALSLIKKKNNNIKLITRCHGHDLYNERYSNCRQPFKFELSKYVDKVIPISKMGYDYYLDNFPINKSKIDYNRLGTERIGAIAKFLFREKELNIVSCSNLIKLKRVNLIIEALSKIDTIKINWIHFGDGPLMEELTNLAKMLLKDKSNINYKFNGYTKNEVIHEYYKNNIVDYFITTSETEGIPFTIMESNSYGIPFIATDVGAIKEAFLDNGSMIAKDFNVEELSLLLIEKANLDEESRMKERINSRKVWEERFDSNKNYLDFVKIIESL